MSEQSPIGVSGSGSLSSTGVNTGNSYLDQYLQAGGGSTTTNEKATDPSLFKVFMGRQPVATERQMKGLGGWPQGVHDQAVSLQEAYNDYYTWQPQEQQAWTSKLFRAGLISDPSDVASALAFWKQAVDLAGGQYTVGHKKVTPWDMAQQMLGLAEAQNGKKNKPTTETRVNTSTEVLNSGDADNMITTMYQNELGRNPTDGELSRYRSMLINKSRNDPTTSVESTTTTPLLDKSGAASGNTTVDTSTNQQDGWSQAGLNNSLQQQVQADPEWGAYQAATTYMNALEQTMSGAPDLTQGH